MCVYNTACVYSTGDSTVHVCVCVIVCDVMLCIAERTKSSGQPSVGTFQSRRSQVCPSLQFPLRGSC